MVITNEKETTEYFIKLFIFLQNFNKFYDTNMLLPFPVVMIKINTQPSKHFVSIQGLLFLQCLGIYNHTVGDFVGCIHDIRRFHVIRPYEPLIVKGVNLYKDQKYRLLRKKAI